jgi:four helix bundle suffix protein
MKDEQLISPHGGYRKLKSFQVAELVYDLTVRFCDEHIDRRSRTHDQMVQAARSGVQNIAEGSQASGTSKKMELKLTNVARASLEELRRDYEDFLRQRGLALWLPDHPALKRFKSRRCSALAEFGAWVLEELKGTQTNTDVQGQSVSVRALSVSSVPVRARPCPPSAEAELAANGALSLLNVCCYLLDRQLAAQAAAFEREGGFTERLYRVRQARRRDGPCRDEQ